MTLVNNLVNLDIWSSGTNKPTNLDTEVEVKNKFQSVNACTDDFTNNTGPVSGSNTILVKIYNCLNTFTFYLFRYLSSY